MQNLKLLFITLILFSACTSTTAFAGKELCPKDAIHCSYVTGLSSDLNDGRYIKLSNNKVNLVVCFNSYGLALMFEEGAGKYQGTNADQYSICTDKSGTKCEPIGVDTFVVSKNGDGKYFAEPKYFDINLSKVKDKYPVCGLSGKNTVKL